MLTITTNIKGLNPSKIEAMTKLGARGGLFLVGNMLKQEFIKQVLARPKSGRLYRIAGRLHRASAEGETPANLTGNYRKSIGFNVSGWDELEFGNSAYYAGWLENGTARMGARKGLLNSINAIKQNKIGGIIEKEIGKRLK
jgi:hypothetical protein